MDPIIGKNKIFVIFVAKSQHSISKKVLKYIPVDIRREILLKKLLTIFSLCVFSCVVFSLDADLEETTGIVKNIVIEGTQNVNDEAILSVIKTKQGGVFVEATLREDEVAIQNLGFFKDVKVLGRTLNDTEREVLIEVQENPMVKQLKITGNTVIDSDSIQEIVLRYQPLNSVFNLRSAHPINKAISDKYFCCGYFAAIDLAPDSEDPNTLIVRIVEKTIGKIEIKGLCRTNECVIRRLIKSCEGKPFNYETWAADKRRLSGTRWFDEVSSQGRETGELGNLDLILNVKEASTGQFKLGVVMPQHGSLAGALGFSDSNLFGTGQTLAANFQYAVKSNGENDGFFDRVSGSIDYVNPFVDDCGTSITARAFSLINQHFTTSAFGRAASPLDGNLDERRAGASFNISRPLGKCLLGSAGVSLERIDAISVPEQGSFIQQDGRLITVPLQLAIDTRDVHYDPRCGHFVKLLVEPGFGDLTASGGVFANELALGNYRFVRAFVEAKKFWPLRKICKGESADTPIPVLAARIKGGGIWGDFPFFEQFFVGGAGSLRGHTDQRFWGKYVAAASVELRYPITSAFNLFAFVDAGSAWGGYPTLANPNGPDFTQTKNIDIKFGYGPGAEFRTPLGKIRIALGYRPNGGMETHFSIGAGGF